MRKYNYTLDQAYEYTKTKRATISPNFNFLGQLLTLESEVLSKQIQEPTCPSTVGIPLLINNRSLKIDTKRIPLINTPMNNTNTQLFTYSPKSYVNFLNFSTAAENISPFRVLLTPSW